MIVGIVGLPLTAPRPSTTERFPCENCPCGCATAEFCWDKCCCHTDAEKLAWAAENGVQPPAFLIARVQQSSAPANTVARSDSQQKTASCCCCCSENAPSCDTAGDTNEASENAANTPAASDDVESSVRLVLLEDAARCRGIDMIWSIFSEAVIESPPVTVASTTPWLLFLLAIENDCVASRTLCPDPPVP
ncbi:MAG: hypothetical protein ACF787_06815 [Rhodopirellula sp. JB053]|uniref:hypothetical protein n=1 Tax=Rhodopirellula sp. JB044 TaxID=3342844 RepID=UPI00370C429A